MILEAIGIITLIIVIFVALIKIIYKKKISPEYNVDINIQAILNDIVYNKNSYSMDEMNVKINEILDIQNTQNKDLRKVERKKIINYIKNRLIGLEMNKTMERDIILNYTNEINSYFRYLEEFDEIDNIIYNN